MKEEILEIIETIETEGKELNEAQKDYLHEKYRQHFGFTYAEGHLCYLFSMREKDYAKMEYYFGWEYERESRELLLNYNGKVIVSYELCDRITEVMYKLVELENESALKE